MILIYDLCDTLITLKLIIWYMTKRITIMLDENLFKKLRILQSKKILQTGKGVSFSKIINDTLRKDLK